MAGAKEKLLAAKNAVNSSKRTRELSHSFVTCQTDSNLGQTLSKQAAKRAAENPGPAVGSPSKRAKARRGVKK